LCPALLFVGEPAGNIADKPRPTAIPSLGFSHEQHIPGSVEPGRGFEDVERLFPARLARREWPAESQNEANPKAAAPTLLRAPNRPGSTNRFSPVCSRERSRRGRWPEITLRSRFLSRLAEAQARLRPIIGSKCLNLQVQR